MPIGIGAATLIAGGLATGAAGAQAIATGKLNKKNRQWQEKMYERQKMDNQEYNSPAAQMQRLKAAGLNPHLIYGNMSTATPVAPASIGTPDQKTPEIANIGSAAANTIAAYQSAQQAQSSMDIQAQQLENMKTANQLQMLDGMAKFLAIDKAKFNNLKMEEMYNYSLDMMKGKIENMTSDTMLKDTTRHINLAENDRKDLANIRSERELQLKIEDMALKQTNSTQSRAMMQTAINKMNSEIKLNDQKYKDIQLGLSAQSSYAERQIMESGSAAEKEVWGAIKGLLELVKTFVKPR